MRYVASAFLSLTALIAAAEEPTTPPATKGSKIYQTDAYGRIRYDKPSWVVKEDGRLIEVSPYGREESHKQQYVIKDNRVQHADGTGQVQHNKPSWTLGKDGRVIQNDALGNPQYHKPQYIIEDGKVYAADVTGQAKRPAYEIKKK